jgi:hypothetical protein
MAQSSPLRDLRYFSYSLLDRSNYMELIPISSSSSELSLIFD